MVEYTLQPKQVVELLEKASYTSKRVGVSGTELYGTVSRGTDSLDVRFSDGPGKIVGSLPARVLTGEVFHDGLQLGAVERKTSLGKDLSGHQGFSELEDMYKRALEEVEKHQTEAVGKKLAKGTDIANRILEKA